MEFFGKGIDDLNMELFGGLEYKKELLGQGING